jgi:hypothetical protein
MWGRQLAIWTNMESSFLSFWQNGMMHVDLVLCPSCVHEKLGMNQNATAIRSNGLCRGWGQSYQWQHVQMLYVHVFILLLCYWYIHKKLAVIFRLCKLERNCEHLVYTCHL